MTDGKKAGRKASLLVNTKSRRGREWFAEVERRLKDGGLDLVESRAIKNPKEISGAVAAQIKAGIPLVIVGGGDGTFSAVVRLFANSEATLGVLPLGTGNAFARDLGIDAQVESSCDAILNGKESRVDMGIVGARQFVNVATVGISTGIAQSLEDGAKKKFGRAAYVFSLLRAMATTQPFRVALELADGKHEFDCLQLTIGNGRFHAGPFPLAPDASITGGWLSVYALASRRKGAFVKMALHLRGGKHVELDEVKAFRVKGGCLVASPMQRVTIDGEVCLNTPVEFGIAPGALRVMTPQDFDDDA